MTRPDATTRRLVFISAIATSHRQPARNWVASGHPNVAACRNQIRRHCHRITLHNRRHRRHRRLHIQAHHLHLPPCATRDATTSTVGRTNAIVPSPNRSACLAARASGPKAVAATTAETLAFTRAIAAIRCTDATTSSVSTNAIATSRRRRALAAALPSGQLDARAAISPRLLPLRHRLLSLLRAAG